MKKGAEVISEGMMNIHVSGHANQEEIKLLHALIRPKYFVPIHGEFRHLCKHKEIAIELGMNKENIFIMGVGDVLELNDNAARLNGSVPSGDILVDGLGVGDVGNIVLRDRKHLSNDGLVIAVIAIDKATSSIVSGPDIISRGFVYVRESEQLISEAKRLVRNIVNTYDNKTKAEWSNIKFRVKEALREYLWQKIKRSPMILPIIMEI
jgi:ribonuclease J